MEWCDAVSKRALTSLEERKWNKEPLVPLTEDLHMMPKFLDDKLKTLKSHLADDPTPEGHKAFAEVLLARLILFNRRRQGEAGRMSVEAFEKADHVQTLPNWKAR